MHDISLWTIYGVYAILFLLILLCTAMIVLLRRHVETRNPEADQTSDAGDIGDVAKVLAAIIVMTDSVEAMRGQNAAEHSAIQSPTNDTNRMVRRVLARFGFLTANDPLPTDFASSEGKKPAPPAPAPPKVNHDPKLS